MILKTPSEVWNKRWAPTVPASDEGVEFLSDNELLDRIAYLLPSVPDTTAKRMALLSCSEFCERTGALLLYAKGSVSDGTGGTALVKIEPPDSHRVLRVVGAKLSGVEVARDDVTVVDNDEGGSSVDFTKAIANGSATGSQPAIVEYSAAPDSAAVGLKLPKWFFARHEKALLNGTLYRLLSMTGDTNVWTDRVQARAYATAFAKDMFNAALGLLPSRMRQDLTNIGFETQIAALGTDGSGSRASAATGAAG